MISYYFREFPLTCIIVALNVAIFIWINALAPNPYLYLNVPGTFSLGTFLAHFAHQSIIHIFFNMFVFAQISPILEKYLGQMTYLLVLVAIWILTVGLMRPVLDTPTLGFSGILMGLMSFVIFLFYHVPQIRNQLVFWLGINLLVGLSPGISFWGHFMGALAGLIVFFTYSMTRDRRG